jgi:hypothetical protein
VIPRMAAPPLPHRNLDAWMRGPTCPDCRIPLVLPDEMNWPESCCGLPLGCPACGEGCDGTPEQITAVRRASAMYRRVTAKDEARARAEGRILAAGGSIAPPRVRARRPRREQLNLFRTNGAGSS